MRELDRLLHVYWERFALWISGILIAVCAWIWVEQYGRIADLESKVQQLQIDKASRQELTALQARLCKRMDGMKSDIIDSLDWYSAGRKSKEH